jgi:hypothetical protein
LEPSRTSSGWKATMTRGTSSVNMTDWTKLGIELRQQGGPLVTSPGRRREVHGEVE